MGMVWLAEFVNAAIEAAVNTATQEYHPMAQVSKDVAAGGGFGCRYRLNNCWGNAVCSAIDCKIGVTLGNEID